jgi:hypothetical protein
VGSVFSALEFASLLSLRSLLLPLVAGVIRTENGTSPALRAIIMDTLRSSFTSGAC